MFDLPHLLTSTSPSFVSHLSSSPHLTCLTFDCIPVPIPKLPLPLHLPRLGTGAQTSGRRPLVVVFPGLFLNNYICFQEDQEDHAAEHRAVTPLYQRDAVRRAFLQQPHLLPDHPGHGGSGDEPTLRPVSEEEPGLQGRGVGGRTQPG